MTNQKKSLNENKTSRTSIGDLSEIGNDLSDEQLRRVSGSMINLLGGLGGFGGGMTSATSKTTYPASMTNPGEPDTARDTESD